MVLAPLGGIARRMGIPVSVTIHGLDVTYDNKLYRRWLRLHLDRFDAYVCNSEATAEAAAEAGVPRERAHVFGIGVAVPTPSMDPREDQQLLFVGRLVRRKGLAWFVREVLPGLAAERPGLGLTVIGGGPEQRAVEAAAREAGVADRVRFEGVLDDAAKARWLARATVCVMPNVPIAGDIEGYGIVALEAAAAGCPLLAADLEGLRYAVIDGETGRLVPSGDACAWLRALREWLDDPAARAAAGARAREVVATERRWDDVIDRYVALFEGLSRARGRQP
jgi:phosphatidylinositol alpha-1,6-mannosyltransferase